MPDSLSSLSARNVARVALQRGPGYPSVLSDREIGGPEDPADRRLILDTKTLEVLLERSRQSLTGRVVLHNVGLRVQLLLDDTTGHRWENVTLIGTEPKPENTGLWRNA